jgi:hypothetical protein
MSHLAASGHDGDRVPENTLDNNLNTRWSNPGIGSYVAFRLGSEKVVCSVDIAWYRGNLRQSNFEIYIWDSQWIRVFSGKSSGTTNSLERYDFPDVKTVAVLIMVNGNTENNYASISEVEINTGR